MPPKNYVPVYGLGDSQPADSPNSGRVKYNGQIADLDTRAAALEDTPVSGSLSYQGGWDAATNTPALASATGTQNHYYVVSVAGSTDLDGITDWAPGDWAIFNGSSWQRIDNSENLSGGITEAEGDARYARILGDPAEGQHFAWSEGDGMLVPVEAPVSDGGGTLPAPIPVFQWSATPPKAWANIAASVTEFDNNLTYLRNRADLTNATQARMVVHTVLAANAGAELAMQYSTDLSTWNYLDGVGGPSSLIDQGNATLNGSWVNLAVGAKADVHLRVVGRNGNGTADPSFTWIEMQVK